VRRRRFLTYLLSRTKKEETRRRLEKMLTREEASERGLGFVRGLIFGLPFIVLFVWALYEIVMVLRSP
jgi:hypothetical protein